MPRPRFEKLPQEKRVAILDAAGLEFADHGYRGASLNAIIEAAGISKGAFYYYFDDKADLFATVVAFARDEIMGAPEGNAKERLATLTGDVYWAALEEMTRRSVEYSEQHPWLLKLGKIIHSIPEDAQLATELAPFVADLQELLRVWIERGQELGLVRADIPQELLISIVGAFDMVADRWFVESWERYTRAELERFGQVTITMFRNMLAPEEKP